MADNSFIPTREEYCNILKDYALSGLEFFKKFDSSSAKKIQETVGRIETRSEQIQYKFSEAAKGRQCSFDFIPTPDPGHSNFKIAFYVPRFQHKENGEFSCAFCLVLWINQLNESRTIAFRLEPSDGDESAHAYPHLQLSRVVKDPDHKTSLAEPWVPDSYPAFPFGLASPVGFFTAIATSVHGYSRSNKTKYAPATLQKAMAQGNDARRARTLVKEIDRLLGN